MRIIGTKDLYDAKYIKLVETYYSKDNFSDAHIWVHAERPNKINAVHIIALVNNLLVVTKEYRVATQAYVYGLPAGLLDKPGESLKEAITRELKEETGLDLVKIKEITPLLLSSPGLTNEGSYFAYVEATGAISNNYLEDNEDIKTYLFNQKEVKSLLSSDMHMIDKGAYFVYKEYALKGAF